jgi:hypothetical protein
VPFAVKSGNFFKAMDNTNKELSDTAFELVVLYLLGVVGMDFSKDKPSYRFTFSGLN